MLTIFKPMDEIFPRKLFNPKNIFQKERETKLRNAIKNNCNFSKFNQSWLIEIKLILIKILSNVISTKVLLQFNKKMNDQKNVLRA